ncbi:EamA family transporter RarD [Vibrio fluvialis]|uniref:RarD protein n=2 Tax=Vibrio fluvialis TaxID=676 RepID=S7I788_VIBFL|nr:RarD protein [Vibrio fluvialis PG41]EPP27264.1 RarD protein [Vibrio fluvialis I21563]MBL4304192.1 EamA family transporter RarD [Vibrio fluvialis]MBY7802023.1 EamA family transporter RarD [Vibrio fluvialis]MBY7839999.1 EamA family transporter RarD [Vibrio fluvialis]
MQKTMHTPLGVTLNVIASALFALMFAYTALLQELKGEEIYGWRILLTFPLLTLFILLRGYWSQVATLFQRLRTERFFWLSRIVSSFLIGIQLWLFMWAPVNGYGLSVSLGYFIMPITMVVVGRFAFKDRMSRFQQLACLFALVGVINQLAISQTLSWPTLMVCLGYPIYFWLRYKTDTNQIGGLWFDMMLSLPFSLYFIFHSGDVLQALSINLDLLWLILGLGAISALALAFQSLSAPHLNLTLFGLLVYVEPVLLLLVALLLGESIYAGEWPTYIAIWLAVVVLMIEGGLSLRKSRTVKRTPSDEPIRSTE